MSEESRRIRDVVKIVLLRRAMVYETKSRAWVQDLIHAFFGELKVKDLKEGMDSRKSNLSNVI